MQITRSSRKNRYLTRVNIFLIAVVLIAAIVGCDGETHVLSIASTSGGSVTEPGEGAFTYGEGMVVNLIAEAEAGYRFVNWTGDVSKLADVEVATTSVTMEDSYSIIANFAVAYNLTITSTIGGNVTTPGEGEFAYNAGTVVNLIVEADDCYRFANWIGDVTTVDNVTAAITTITMNDSYFIIASFEHEEPIYFPDANLETAVRENINKPIGSIYPCDVTSLFAELYNISNLTGLEHCINLREVHLQHNPITDISPLANLINLAYIDLSSTEVSNISALANLTGLEYLNLGSNQINNIEPLANLTNLKGLFSMDTQISDISPLANLIGLNYLHLHGNQISDISPIANLKHVWDMRLSDNQISDISPIANLINLHTLDLSSNQISNIEPLVDNTGLATSDYVWLEDNPLSDDSINIYIPALEARGLTVYY